MEDTSNKPLVSIIVPFYNAFPYIKQCLDSITNQIYKNYQVILVDDGSTDKSSSIARLYCKDNNKFIYHRCKHGGVSYSRNIGVSLANTKYCVFIDADDYVSTEYLNKLVNKMIETNDDLVCCSFKYINNSNSLIQKYNPIKENRYMKNSFWEEYYSNSERDNIRLYTVVLWNKIYKTKLLKQFKFFNSICEDELFMHRYIDKSNYISCIKDELYYYRINRPHSLTYERKKLKVESLKDKMDNTLNRFYFFKEHQYSKKIIFYSAMACINIYFTYRNHISSFSLYLKMIKIVNIILFSNIKDKSKYSVLLNFYFKHLYKLLKSKKS